VIHPLPVSRHHIVLREPNGHEEALLAEIRPGSLPARLEVVRRLAPPTDSGLDWDRLPAVDVDAALLALRRRLIGERMIAEVVCSRCRATGDVIFSVTAYLAAHTPKPRHTAIGPLVRTVWRRQSKKPPSNSSGCFLQGVLVW